MTGAAADAHDVWAKAREENDFALFLPHLERAVELKRRYIECFEGYDEPYDVLLDDFEPGMKTAEVRAVFDDLKTELVPLIAEIGSVDGDDAFMSGPWPVDAQHAYSLRDHRALRLRRVVRAARPDRAPVRRQLGHAGHPPDDALQGRRHHLDLHGDARVRARPLRARRLALARADAALPRRLLGAARVAEPDVGEHRRPQPRVLELLLPVLPGGVPAGASATSTRSASTARSTGCKPSYIRVDADEATYNLHIILRFELEQEIFAGTIELKDLPDEWNRRFEEYLGIPVPTDTLGVLQDVHWSGGGFGYFPTYSLGNIVSVQIWEKVLSRAPRPPRAVRAGRVRPAARVAADAALLARAQVHAAGDARARGRRRRRSTRRRTSAT